jgi:hypothetical protein
MRKVKLTTDQLVSGLAIASVLEDRRKAAVAARMIARMNVTPELPGVQLAAARALAGYHSYGRECTLLVDGPVTEEDREAMIFALNAPFYDTTPDFDGA